MGGRVRPISGIHSHKIWTESVWVVGQGRRHASSRLRHGDFIFRPEREYILPDVGRILMHCARMPARPSSPGKTAVDPPREIGI